VDYQSYPSLCEQDRFTDGLPVPNLTLLGRLLDGGADPNQSYGGDSVWTKVMLEARDISGTVSIPYKTRTLMLGHWSDIAEILIRHGADPLINRDSQIGSRIREAFGTHVPDRAKDLERLLKRTQRRWSSLGKFLVPSLKARPPPSLEEITALPVLNKLRSINSPQASLGEYYIRKKPEDPDDK
jgi:hypothetical protein